MHSSDGHSNPLIGSVVITSANLTCTFLINFDFSLFPPPSLSPPPYRRRGRLRQAVVVEDQKVVAIGFVHETGPTARIRTGERARGDERLSRARPAARARQFRGLLQQPDQLRRPDVSLDEHEPGVDVDGHVERGGSGGGGAAMSRQAQDQGEGEDQVEGLRQRGQPGLDLHLVVRVDVHVHVRVRLGPVERQLQPARA